MKEITLPERDMDLLSEAAHVLAALKHVPKEKRMEVLAIVCDAFVKGALNRYGEVAG